MKIKNRTKKFVEKHQRILIFTAGIATATAVSLTLPRQSRLTLSEFEEGYLYSGKPNEYRIRGIEYVLWRKDSM